MEQLPVRIPSPRGGLAKTPHPPPSQPPPPSPSLRLPPTPSVFRHASPLPPSSHLHFIVTRLRASLVQPIARPIPHRRPLSIRETHHTPHHRPRPVIDP